MDQAQPAFEIDGRPLSIGAVLARALIGGHLREPVAELVRALSALQLAEQAGTRLEPAELQTAVNTWRSAHDQSSGDETREWLEHHGLELSQLIDHVERLALLARDPAPNDDDLAEPPSTSDVLELLLSEQIFTDRLVTVVELVARECALIAEQPQQDVRAWIKKAEAAAAQLGGRVQIAESLGLPILELDEAVAHVARFLLARRELLSRTVLDQQLARDRKNLTRVELAYASFADEGVALETLHCLRDEKKWIEPLGGEMGFRTERVRYKIEDLVAMPLGAQLALGQAGDTFGPVQQDDAWRVFEVLERVEPDLSDEEIRTIVETRALERLARSAVERRVRIRYR